MLMEILFWLLIGTVVWTYVGYPLLLRVLSRFRNQDEPSSEDPLEPSVSLIIAAYNEEKAIRLKLENALKLDYPRAKLQIIVASDQSTDDTHDIVDEFASQNVKLVVLTQRGGKTAAQNLAVKNATGDILVFTDATTEFEPTALRKLVQGFANPRVGCVGSMLQYESKGGTAVGRGAGAYWRYERWVKGIEGRVNSMIGVSGCFYAVRAELYRPIEPDLISDFVIAMDIFSQGYITVPAQGAVSHESTHEDPGKEFEMRVRVIIRSINALVQRMGMLNPLRYGFFALQLISHKLLRYLVPELLLGALAVNLWLVFFTNASPLYSLLLVGFALVGGGSLLGWIGLKYKLRLPFVHIPFYFVHANTAALWALVLYLRGERMVVWTTVR